MKILIFEYKHHENDFYIRINAIKRFKNNMQNHEHPIRNYNAISLHAYLNSMFWADICIRYYRYRYPVLYPVYQLSHIPPPGLYLKFGAIG